jgi:DNA-binding NtrC family response regulator
VRESSHLTPVANCGGAAQPTLGVPHRREASAHAGARPGTSDAAHRAPLPPRALVCISREPNDALIVHLRSIGWHVTLAKSAADAARLIKPDCVAAGLVDLDGFAHRDLAALEACLRQPTVGWVALTSPARLIDPDVRRLIRNYCFDYLKAPATSQAVEYVIGHAFGMVALCDLDLAAPGVTVGGDDEMVGTCDAMQQLFRTIRKIANTDASVFISGESGTGKELTAVAIHERSSRRKAPFVAINCGAIPHHLMQSELFGYERGAFTGANGRKIGRVEAANGGTLFLDEIGDMPLEAQTGLLRFLQEGKIERLGGRESIPVDVRIISATHVDLDVAIREGRFRMDLFHRLCVLRVDEPPLRARGSDIEILAHHILHKFKSDNARKIRGFTPAAVEALYRYPWPGNVRELINRVRRAIVMCDGRLITPDDLGLEHLCGQQPMTLSQARDVAEKRAIESALLRHRHRLNEAAVDLGISRVTLYRLMCAHGLRETADKVEHPASEGVHGPGEQLS